MAKYRLVKENEIALGHEHRSIHTLFQDFTPSTHKKEVGESQEIFTMILARGE